MVDAWHWMRQAGRSLELPFAVPGGQALALEDYTGALVGDRPGLATTSLFWRAAAQLLAGQPQLALATLARARMLTDPKQAPSFCDELFIESRAHAQLGHLAHALASYQRHVLACRQYALRYEGELLAYQHLAAEAAAPEGTRPQSDLLRQALLRSAARQHVGVTVDDLAGWCGRSKRWLRDEFAQQFQASPTDWLLQQRLLGVRRQLQSLGMSAGITKLAASWGFSNVSRFRAAYLQAFGETPQQTLRTALQAAQPAA